MAACLGFLERVPVTQLHPWARQARYALSNKAPTWAHHGLSASLMLCWSHLDIRLSAQKRLDPLQRNPIALDLLPLWMSPSAGAEMCLLALHLSDLRELRYQESWKVLLFITRSLKNHPLLALSFPSCFSVSELVLVIGIPGRQCRRSTHFLVSHSSSLESKLGPPWWLKAWLSQRTWPFDKESQPSSNSHPGVRIRQTC